MTKPIPWKQVAERDAFISGSDCRRIERRLQPRFSKRLISSQNKSKDLKETGKFRHLRFRDLINALVSDPTFQKFNTNKRRIFVRYFVDKYRLFNTHDTWVEAITNAIDNEKWFLNNLNFWRIPYNLVDNWLKYIVDQKSSYYDSNVLLAIVIIVSKYKSLNKQPPIIQLTCKLTGFEPKTVNGCIDRLKEIGAIKYLKVNKYSSPDIELSDCFQKFESHKRIQPTRPITNWGKDLINLDNIDEFQWIGFMSALPFNRYNPFIAFVYPNLLIHQTMLNTNLLIFSLFDKQQILSLYKIWVSSNYTRSISNRYHQARNYLKNKLDQPRAVFSSEHYKQIFQCSPILHFIAKRKRMIDFQVLYDNLYIQDALKMIFKNELIKLIEFVTIDCEYFLQCLESGNFVKAWEKKYNIEDINPAAMFIDNVPDSKKESFVRDMGEMYEFPLQSYLNAQNNHITLKGIQKFLKTNNLTTLDSNYNCLRIKTHRITFNNYPIQSIRKHVRSFIKASDGKVFLQVDLASAELAILRWFLLKYQKLEPDSLAELDLNYITSRINLDRSLIKTMTYQFLYGASMKTICSKNCLSQKIVKQFRDILLGFPGIRDFQKQAAEYAKKNHLSLPTALGHQFPIFGDPHTQGLSFIIQGTGAELLREWLLGIHKAGIAMEVSNIIHDEIILEVEEKLVFNRAEIVNSCLDKATNVLLPGIILNTKTCISNSWSKSGLSLSKETIDQFTQNTCQKC